MDGEASYFEEKADVVLKGDLSVIGRSLVVEGEDGERIGCAIIV